MENQIVGKNTAAFGLSVIITSLLSMVLVLVKEIGDKTVLPWMASLTGHHWVTHGVFNIVVFVVLGLILAKSNGGQGPAIGGAKLAKLMTITVVIASVVISGFYLAD